MMLTVSGDTGRKQQERSWRQRAWHVMAILPGSCFISVSGSARRPTTSATSGNAKIVIVQPVEDLISQRRFQDSDLDFDALPT